jgi:imidazolonepropionase-like amidohydrolase
MSTASAEVNSIRLSRIRLSFAWSSEEFAPMAQAGLGFADIPASLTTNPARRFGFEEKAGRIAPGMEADLVVLDGDPVRDIGCWRE